MSTVKEITAAIDACEATIDVLLDELRQAERVEDEARWDNPDDTVDQHEQLIIDLGIQMDELREDTRDLRAILEVQRLRATNMYEAQERLIKRVKELENVREGRIPKAARESWEDQPYDEGSSYGYGVA